MKSGYFLTENCFFLLENNVCCQLECLCTYAFSPVSLYIFLSVPLSTGSCFRNPCHFLDSLCRVLKHILRPEPQSLSGLANLHIKNLKVTLSSKCYQRKITLFAAVYRIYICFPLKCDEINQLGIS